MSEILFQYQLNSNGLLLEVWTHELLEPELETLLDNDSIGG